MRDESGGVTVWFTGLPGSGKTTVAQWVRDRLEDVDVPVEWLDGDELRKHMSKGIGFSRQERALHLERVAYLCHLLTKHGVIVLASFVSPYQENRDYARGLIGNRFMEVFVDAPLQECIRRDPKGMYRKALAGEIPQFTGVNDPYERPRKPELTLETAREGVEESAGHVLKMLTDRYQVPARVSLEVR
jgi:adenylylsulfate kinase